MLYRTFFAQTNETDDTIAGLATHSALVTLNKYFKQFKPDKVIMAFDRASWRKQYTASDLCISGKAYKGNRRQDMTPAQRAKYQRFMEHMREFEALIAEHTTIISLQAEMLEADDLIAGVCQLYGSDEDNEIIIISTDTDLLQLKKYPSVRVISPATDKEQHLEDFDGDAELYVFTKCIRGDSTDNVQSAYPGVRMTRIKKAYADPFERANLMKEKWKGLRTVMQDGEPTTEPHEFVVEDLFEENQMLINLEMQPDPIRRLIERSVAEAMAKDRHFSMFHILRFIGKYKLVKIKDSLDQYIPMLSR